MSRGRTRATLATNYKSNPQLSYQILMDSCTILNPNRNAFTNWRMINDAHGKSMRRQWTASQEKIDLYRQAQHQQKSRLIKLHKRNSLGIIVRNIHLSDIF